MRDSISASDVANEMSMTRCVFKGTFLVVEGVTDSRLYSKFTDRDNVRIVIAHSKDNVGRTVSEMTGKRRDRLVVGIVDKDMDDLIGRRRSPPVFTTDSNDIESAMIRSDALDDVVSEYGDREKVERFVRTNGQIRDAVARAASAVGCLMYISYRKGMNLSFKDLDFERFVNSRTLGVDVPRMVSEVYARSMGQMYPKSAVADQVRTMMRQEASPWDSVRGHDAVDVLVIGLRYSFGSYNARRITEGELGGALRLAYDRADFVSTGLYRKSREWSMREGVPLWAERSLVRHVLDPSRGHDLLDLAVALVQDRLAALPQHDGPLVGLQALVEVHLAALKFLDDVLEGLHGLLERHLLDFRVLLRCLLLAHLLSSLLLTSATALPSLMRTTTVDPTLTSFTDETARPPGRET